MFDYDRVLSNKIKIMKPSGIRRFFDMLADRRDVISLTVGQPDFDTPWHVREAGIESLKAGQTGYTSNSGLVELRAEIGRYLRRRFGLEYSTDECIVTVGGSEAIDIAIRSIVDPGDEVLIPDPCFVCYNPLVALCGGVPVMIPTRAEDGFRLRPEALRGHITPRTKLLILPYPNNPTGAVMERADLERLADILRGTGVAVLSDEIYAELTYGGKHCSIASLPDMRERTVVVNGFSKAYSMTGWRMGYVCAPQPLIEQMFKIHQYAIMCAPSTSQYAAVDALRSGDGDIEYMRGDYNGRRRYVLARLREMGVDCFEPLGAFYVFPDFRKFGLSSEEFCQRLLDEQKVGIVPGDAFGACGEGFARISYSYSVKHLQTALDRIEAFVKGL